MKRLNARFVIGFGFALFATSNFMNVHMSADYANDQLFWPNIMRAVGQALVFTPLSAVAAAGIEVGIAMLQTFQTKREQFYSNVLPQPISLFEDATRTRLAALTRYFLDQSVSDQAVVKHKAIVAIRLRVRQQASIMAFSDTFYLLGAALIVALIATMLLKKTDHLDGGAGH
jgi:DHA2 family multidrug resistance protein